jgi:hypothetical protein
MVLGSQLGLIIPNKFGPIASIAIGNIVTR